ncbi:MAG: type I-E CRISPR-associated protein Cse1/CasA [Armatimonadetes bacterium]|nr:type I-E CRISPR-associated protein Cse1/CasA [Armatimonadota bacterium]
MATFDLLSEPWIPVLGLDGRPDELGLRQVLHQAPRLREIRDPLPTVEFGLYRLLVALVMDIHPLRDIQGLADLLDAGQFDSERVDVYFQKWADRFDLFHPEHPFLQTAGMDADETKPLAGLLPPIPSGTGVLHFHHVKETDFGACPAAAARLLTTIPPFMTAGGAGLSPSINGAPPWYGLVVGESLFETLCLNCCVLDLPAASGDAPTAWRNDCPPKTQGRSTSASLLEALTWRPRRIHLIPGGSGRCSLTGADASTLVRTMRFSAGASCDFLWRDPSVPYRITTTKGPSPLRPQEGREVWRDIGPFALLRQADYKSEKGETSFERPPVVTQYTRLVDQDVRRREAPLSLRLYGMRTDMKMKVFEWQREQLPPIPYALLLAGAPGGEAQRAMDQGDSVAYYLKQAIKRAYPRQGAGNTKAFDTLVAAAQRRFWAELRPHYGTLLRTLAQPTPEAEYDARRAAWRADWQQAVRSTGDHALEWAIGDLDTDADALRRLVEARRFFGGGVWSLLNPQAASERRKGRRGAAPSKGGKQR